MKLKALGFSLLAACGAAATADNSQTRSAAREVAGIVATPVRIMEANISTGTHQSYDPGEGQRIFEGVRPDIVTIQEFNYGDDSATAIRGFVDDTFGAAFAYERGTGQIPNGVISRFPIVASGEWVDPAVSNRGFVWAEVALPNGSDLWVTSVHLLTTSAANREIEAVALLADIEHLVPPNAWAVLGGDFNSETRSEACVETLSTFFTTAAPYPVDQLGNANTSMNRNKPHDWLLANHAFAAQQSAVVIGANSFASGLVVDTRVYTPIADLAPALATDSASPDMQHMAVVKDFTL